MIILPSNSSGEYEVANSLRFNDGSSDSLTRTPSSAGNRKTFTLSLWFKRASNFGSTNNILWVGNDSNNRTLIQISDVDVIDLQNKSGGSVNAKLSSNAKRRDPSAWYHLVWSVDTTQGTDSNRMKLYVNGVQETSFSTETYPSQNADFFINNNQSHSIGKQNDASAGFFDGYMAEVVFIDGQALDHTSFGEFDEDTGIWKPIDVSSLTFGTNGFYLDFENSGSLGADVSGNGNNFTVNNLTSGDQATDTCTNNFCLLNPLDKIGAPSLGQANTNVGLTANDLITGNFFVSSGKWYYEVELNSGTESFIGWLRPDVSTYTGNTFQQAGSLVYYSGNGNRYKDGDGGASYGASYSSGDIIGCALNLDDNEVTWYKNGTTQGTISITDGNYVPCFASGGASPVFVVNFGGVESFTISSGNSDGNGYGNFEYAVPSGYYALNSKNLAEYG